MGSYPIAQLREPISVVQFLAERLNLVKLLKLQHPENDETWSAFDVCDGKSNFLSLVLVLESLNGSFLCMKEVLLFI
jgi:hypothetical protein